MLYYTTAFLLVAIAAGFYGMSGITEGAALTGGVLFVLFLMLSGTCFLISKILHPKPKA